MTYDDLPDGSYAFNARVLGTSDQPEETQGSSVFTVDSTSPTVQVGGPDPRGRTRPKLECQSTPADKPLHEFKNMCFSDGYSRRPEKHVVTLIN
jgi:hypothetical protein